MKANYFNSLLAVLLVGLAFFTSCSKEDDSPAPVVLTGLKFTLTVPAGTTGDIFIVGSMNGVHDGPESWKPGQAKYKLSKNSDGTFSITLPNTVAGVAGGVGLEYKYVNGASWDQGEVLAAGCKDEVPNRKVTTGTVNKEFKDKVEAWKHTCK